MDYWWRDQRKRKRGKERLVMGECDSITKIH
jgi:hypothetical protein